MKRLRLSILLLPLALAGCYSSDRYDRTAGTRMRLASRRFPTNAQCPSCRAALWIGQVKEFAYQAEGMGGKPIPCPNCGEEFDPELEKSVFSLSHPS